VDIYETIRNRGIYLHPTEEDLFAEAHREISKGVKSDGIWARALAESDMDIDKARAAYIRLRVQSLKIETSNYISELGRIAADEISNMKANLELSKEEFYKMKTDLEEKTVELDIKVRQTIATEKEKAREEVRFINSRLKTSESEYEIALSELNITTLQLKETKDTLSKHRIAMWISLIAITSISILIYSGNAIIIFSK
jgi:hypothetical protein